MTGWRWTKVAMHPTPRRSRDVTPASADSSVTDSRRGFASRLSPAHAASKIPERSASTVSSTRSAALTAPRTTARLARMSPNDGFVTRLPPRVVRRPLLEERRHALGVVVRGAEPRVRLALQLERRREGRLRAAVEHHLERAERQRRARRQLAGERRHRLVELVVRHGLRDEPPRFGALGADPLARHHEELPARHAHKPQGALCSA